VVTAAGAPPGTDALPGAGALLDGRLTYHQPATGFRSGIEPVLLAAATPAAAGERVLEAGTGAGAALLCLHARVPGIRSLGIEIHEATARLAALNAAACGFASLEVRSADIETAVLPGEFDHAIANPPYHPERGTPSPDAARDLAKRGSAALLQVWVQRLAGRLRARGTLTLILPAGLVPACLAAMADARCACGVIFPLWPMAGRAAKLVIVRGVRDSRATMRLAPGLVLHQPDGAFTDAAQAVLRDGAALALD